jgi:mannose-6-phosphate isomerase-like protein (cupin superfamily)
MIVLPACTYKVNAFIKESNMIEDLKQISRRMKEIREINGISIETLAKEFSINIDVYKKYESGESDIPIGVLYQLGNKFNIDLTAIITGEEPKMKIYSLVRKGNAPSVDRRKDYNYVDLGYNFINKKAETFLVSVDADKSPVKLNSHDGQEFTYVLEGSLKAVIDKYELELGEGDSLYFDSGYEHGFRSQNGKPAKFLAIIFK